MFLWNLLKKFSKNQEKREIIREVIFRLELDKKQEQIYIESLDILDNIYLDIFYKKLTALVYIIEEKDIITSHKKQTQTIHLLQEKEKKEKYNTNFNILLDNI